jgi:hypothetical protein
MTKTDWQGKVCIPSGTRASLQLEVVYTRYTCQDDTGSCFESPPQEFHDENTPSVMLYDTRTHELDDVGIHEEHVGHIRVRVETCWHWALVVPHSQWVTCFDVFGIVCERAHAPIMRAFLGSDLTHRTLFYLRQNMELYTHTICAIAKTYLAATAIHGSSTYMYACMYLQRSKNLFKRHACMHMTAHTSRHQDIHMGTHERHTHTHTHTTCVVQAILQSYFPATSAKNRVNPFCSGSTALTVDKLTCMPDSTGSSCFSNKTYL